jgi:hypothetical protein
MNLQPKKHAISLITDFPINLDAQFKKVAGTPKVKEKTDF